MKRCTSPKCENVNPQPLGNFNKRKDQKDGLNYWCRDCCRRYAKESKHRHKEKIASWNEENKEKIKKQQKARSRKWTLKHRYDLTVEKYNEKVAEQENKCAICKKEETYNYCQPLSVDHCHSTGKVRGLLCNSCNTGLGKFNDDPALLAKAIEYLRGT